LAIISCLIFVVSKHEPPDLLDLDPEFLSTLNLPRTSTDSLENEPNAMENWQMNEVFQDISVMLDVSQFPGLSSY